jgi:hypothetical protein
MSPSSDLKSLHFVNYLKLCGNKNHERVGVAVANKEKKPALSGWEAELCF